MTLKPFLYDDMISRSIWLGNDACIIPAWKRKNLAGIEGEISYEKSSVRHEMSTKFSCRSDSRHCFCITLMQVGVKTSANSMINFSDACYLLQFVITWVLFLLLRRGWDLLFHVVDANTKPRNRQTEKITSCSTSKNNASSRWHYFLFP